MKKKFRVKSEKEFQRVFHQGTSVANRQLVLYVYPKPEQAHFRVGLSVGKKMGNAVVRNRLKRLMREAIRAEADKIQPEYDFILIARPDIKKRSLDEIKRSLIHVMNLADVLQPKQIQQSVGGRHETK